MAKGLYQKLKKHNLHRRLRIYHVLVYVAAAISLGSFAFCIIDWQGVSLLLIGILYAMFSVHFVMEQRVIRKELARREAWRATKAEAGI